MSVETSLQAENIQRTQQLYQAFNGGEIDKVLASLSPDIRWSNPGPADLEYFGVRVGIEQVIGLFQLLGRDFEFTELTPVEYFATGDKVAVLVRLSATIRPTGKSYREDAAQIFTYGPDGLVTEFLDIQDSATIADALRP